MRFSFHHRVSDDPDVNSIGAVETVADLTNTHITKTERVGSRDGNLVSMDAECEQKDCEEFLKSLRTFRLLY